MRCTATVCRPRSKRAAKDEDRGHSKSLGLVSRTRRNYRHRDCPGILRGGLVAFACRSCPFHDGGGPFAFWESQFSGLQEDDEVRRSILPSAYRDDDSADAQFHVDHDAEDVAARWEDAQSLSADVETLHRTGCISMNPVMTQRWLRTVNALRGMMAARLGIIDQVTADEVARAARGPGRNWVPRRSASTSGLASSWRCSLRWSCRSRCQISRTVTGSRNRRLS